MLLSTHPPPVTLADNRDDPRTMDRAFLWVEGGIVIGLWLKIGTDKHPPRLQRGEFPRVWSGEAAACGGIPLQVTPQSSPEKAWCNSDIFKASSAASFCS